MKKRNQDNNEVKIELVSAMLSHVPFDGWTWTAMEQGAVDINFKKNKSENERLQIYKTFFNNGSIDFIKVFAEIIDSIVQENYHSLDPKPQKIPEKIKKLILMRLDFCLPYKEPSDLHCLYQLYQKIQNNRLTFYTRHVIVCGD
tara:strand:- start:899 stop:1330 length:432 start_codon:yes stop_codon:yes gene_type:complete